MTGAIRSGTIRSNSSSDRSRLPTFAPRHLSLEEAFRLFPNTEARNYKLFENEESEDPEEYSTPPTPQTTDLLKSVPKSDDDTPPSNPQPKRQLGLHFSNMQEVNRHNNVPLFAPNEGDITLPQTDANRQTAVRRLIDAIYHVELDTAGGKAKNYPKAFQSRWIKRTYYSLSKLRRWHGRYWMRLKLCRGMDGPNLSMMMG